MWKEHLASSQREMVSQRPKVFVVGGGGLQVSRCMSLISTSIVCLMARPMVTIARCDSLHRTRGRIGSELEPRSVPTMHIACIGTLVLLRYVDLCMR